MRAPWRVLAPNRFACFPEPDFSLGLRIFAVCALPSPPILLRLALHRWRIRIFYFQPKRRAAPAIGRAEAFAYNALATETASLAKYGSRPPRVFERKRHFPDALRFKGLSSKIWSDWHDCAPPLPY